MKRAKAEQGLKLRSEAGMRTWVALSIFVSALSLPGLASAQRAGPYIPGARESPPQMDMDRGNAARVALKSYATCLVQRFKNRIMVYIEAPLGKSFSSKQLSFFADPGCLNAAMMRIPQVNFRGALFEALIESQDDSLAALSPTSESMFLTRNPNVKPEYQTLLTLEQFGECVTRGKSTEVAALLKTDPGSAAEAELFDQLQPSMSACISKDRTFTLSKTILRGALAEGMYWLRRGASG